MSSTGQPAWSDVPVTRHFCPENRINTCFRALDIKRGMSRKHPLTA
jgi:hypothetical protein